MLEMLHKFTEGRLGTGWDTEGGRGRCEDRENPKSLSRVGMLATQEGGLEHRHPFLSHQLHRLQGLHTPWWSGLNASACFCT